MNFDQGVVGSFSASMDYRMEDICTAAPNRVDFFENGRPSGRSDLKRGIAEAKSFVFNDYKKMENERMKRSKDATNAAPVNLSATNQRYMDMEQPKPQVYACPVVTEPSFGQAAVQNNYIHRQEPRFIDSGMYGCYYRPL